MLYELSSCEVSALQSACVVAQVRMSENAESSERCANNQHLPEAERASAARVAKWYHGQAATFEAAREALYWGRALTTLEQAKKALER
mgnify:CR=1 FL=1